MLLWCMLLLRKGNFDLYLQSLAQIVLWMFALGLDTKHTIPLSVRIRDMMSLLVNHPDIRAELLEKLLCTKQAASVHCSAMIINQCHEQYNGAVKVSVYAQELWQSLKWQDRLQHNHI